MSIPVPPEIAEEFAEAYREAYARALAEQSPTARHVELPDDHDDLDDVPDDERWAHELPVRAVPPADGGAHRDPEPAQQSESKDERTSREAQRMAAQARAKRDARKRAEAEAVVAARQEPQDDSGPNLFWLLVVICVLCLVLGAYILGLAFVD